MTEQKLQLSLEKLKKDQPIIPAVKYNLFQTACINKWENIYKWGQSLTDDGLKDIWLSESSSKCLHPVILTDPSNSYYRDPCFSETIFKRLTENQAFLFANQNKTLLRNLNDRHVFL